MINFTELTETQNAAFEALVAAAKEQAQPEAEGVAADYEEREAIKLSAKRSISKDKAVSVVRARRHGNLDADDIINFQGGMNVTVSEILTNSAKYDGLSCADPCEPEEGTNRAKFFANINTGSPIINSMLHGGQIYLLGTSPADDFGEQQKDQEATVEDLLELADLIDPGDTVGMKELLGSSRHLDEIDMHRLLTCIKKKTGMTLGAMKSFLRGNSGSGSEIDHLQIAKKMIEQLGVENLLSVEDGVYIWLDRGVWKMMEKGDLKQRAQRAIEEDKSVMSNWVDGVVKVFSNEIYRPNHKFNVGDPEVINCPNGELHLNKVSGIWEMKTHDREAFRTSQIPVSYTPGASAPRFEKFLAEIFVNDPDRSDKIKALLEMFGYSMVAHCQYEKFIILIGAGANGKSVVLAILEALVGAENTVGVQPSQFDNRFQRAHLRHKLANIVTEIRQGEVIADAELKGIVSGEPSTVENKFKDPFTMRPYATCWFATNHMPHTRDFSEALFRRALILKFNQIFSSTEKNPTLKDELIAELPGILNLALEAYGNAVREGFTDPVSSEEAKEEWRLEADQVQQFVLDCCERSPIGRIESGVLYSAYKDWADESGIRMTLTHRNFGTD